MGVIRIVGCVFTLGFSGCVHAPVVKPEPVAVVLPAAKSPVTRVLEDFLAAVDAKDFSRALALTSASWRQRYTVEQFAADFATEPLASERVTRVRAALALPVQLTEHAASIPLGEGRVLRLLQEPDGFRVSALE